MRSLIARNQGVDVIFEHLEGGGKAHTIAFAGESAVSARSERESAQRQSRYGVIRKCGYGSWTAAYVDLSGATVVVCDAGDLGKYGAPILRRLRIQQGVAIGFSVERHSYSVRAALKHARLVDRISVRGLQETEDWSPTAATQLLAKLGPRMCRASWRVQFAVMVAVCTPGVAPKQAALFAGVTRRSIDRALARAGCRSLSTLCRAASLTRLIELRAQGCERETALSAAGIQCRKSVRVSIRKVLRLGVREFHVMLAHDPDLLLARLIRVVEARDYGATRKVSTLPVAAGPYNGST